MTHHNQTKELITWFLKFFVLVHLNNRYHKHVSLVSGNNNRHKKQIIFITQIVWNALATKKISQHYKLLLLLPGTSKPKSRCELGGDDNVSDDLTMVVRYVCVPTTTDLLWKMQAKVEQDVWRSRLVLPNLLCRCSQCLCARVWKLVLALSTLGNTRISYQYILSDEEAATKAMRNHVICNKSDLCANNNT
jgi:hypothetical protein